MRIPSGVTDQYIYFIAVDSSDLVTRETGLSSFTVYRSRNGGAAVAYTTPTINETDSVNMPGVYELLLDEDMTIDSGDDSQEICLHITHAGMAPVTRIFELYRPKATAGETLTVSSGTGNAAVQSIVANAITASSIASGAFTAAKFAAGALDAVWSTATRLLTAGTNIVLAKGTGVTGFNDLDAAGVRSAVGLASANLDTQLDALPTAAENSTAVWSEITRTITSLDEDTTTLDLDATIRSAVGLASNNLDSQLFTIDTVVDAILVDTNSIEPKIDTIDTTLDALVADIGANGVGLTAIPWNAAWDAEVQSEVNDGLVAYDAATGIDVSAINPPSASTIADAVWDEALSGHVTAGSAGDTLSDVASATSPTVEQIADELETRILDANIVQVNSITVDGSGTEADPWGRS